MIRIVAVPGNTQRLDGGAMFGNAPRALWTRWLPPDERGRVALATRAVLIHDGERRILLETGVGAFFEPRLRERFGITESEHVLLASLAREGLRHEDIDVVVLSHLHFDHAGGLLSVHEEGTSPTLLFPRATFVTSRTAFERARSPHLRDRASFVEGLSEQLAATGRLVLTEAGQARSTALGERFSLTETQGHTPGLLHVTVHGDAGELTYLSDLVPGTPWLHVAVTMGYDRFPEQLVDEKATLLRALSERGAWVAFVHDPTVAFARVEPDGRGGYQASSPRGDRDGELVL